MTLTRLYALLLTPALAACAHAPGERPACAKADYYQLGLADGQSGSRREDLYEARLECAAAGVPLDASRYDQGYKVGLARFCDETLARSDAMALSPHSLCIEEQVTPYVAVYNRQIDAARAGEARDSSEAKKQKLPSDEEKMRRGVKPMDQEKAMEQPSSF